jgi:hypothetical protein
MKLLKALSLVLFCMAATFAFTFSFPLAITFGGIIAVLYTIKKETAQIVPFVVFFLYSLGGWAQQTTTKKLHKTFRPSETNIIILYVPAGTEIVKLHSKASAVQVEYNVSYNTDNENIVNFMTKNGYGFTVDAVEHPASRTELMVHRPSKKVSMLKGNEITVKCNKVTITIPEKTKYFHVIDMHTKEVIN